MVLNMLEKLTQFNEIKKEFLKELQNYWQDTNVPLEERWATFAACDFGPIDSWGPRHFKSLDSDCIMYEGPCHIDRYGVYKYSDVYRSLLSEVEDGNLERIFSSPEYTLDDFREEVLQNGEIGFRHDW